MFYKGKVNFILDKVLKEKGVAKFKLYTMTKIPYDSVLRYCTGEKRQVSLEHLALICDVLDCEVADLFEYKRSYVKDDKKNKETKKAKETQKKA